MATVDAIELETKVKDLYRHGPSSRTARSQQEAGVVGDPQQLGAAGPWVCAERRYGQGQHA
jgi:hypothetical protein